MYPRAWRIAVPASLMSVGEWPDTKSSRGRTCKDLTDAVQSRGAFQTQKGSLCDQSPELGIDISKIKSGGCQFPNL